MELCKKESLFYLMMPLEHIDCLYWLLDIKHTVIVTYFFRTNLQAPHRVLFPIWVISCTFPQTEQHIPQPLLDKL